jgi:hypothetical protein
MGYGAYRRMSGTLEAVRIQLALRTGELPFPPDKGDLDDAERVTDPEQAGSTQWSERVGREVAPAKGTRR